MFALGTLTRCIDSLEQQDKELSCVSTKDSHGATAALRQILNAAYLVNVQVNPGSTFLRSFLDKMKQVDLLCLLLVHYLLHY